MRITSIILLLFFTIKSYATPQDSVVTRIFNLAYNMNYEQAEKLLLENKNNIDEFHFAVLDIDMSYWKNVTGTNTPNYDAFETTLNNYYLEFAKTFNQKGIQLIQLSYQLRYQLKRFRLISAISTHKKTKLLFIDLKNDSLMNSMENAELFQLYDAMFLYFSNYIKPFGGKSKDENCNKAIATMERLTKSERTMTKTLASYLLARTYLRYENTPKLGLNHFKFLSDTYPKNTKFPELLEECREKGN